jgi:hypothetical protein
MKSLRLQHGVMGLQASVSRVSTPCWCLAMTGTDVIPNARHK